MRWIDELRDRDRCLGLLARLEGALAPGRDYRFMEFCGGHTHALFRSGLAGLLPAPIRMIHGPGCPVCVLPLGRIQMAVEVAARPGTILASYGDALRLPGPGGRSLLDHRATGADVRMVYSVLDALRLAGRHPASQVVFLALGFETTTPQTAFAIRHAAATGLRNFSVLSCHVVTPAAIRHVLDAPSLRDMEPVRIDGFLGPGHVAAVIGTRPFEFFAEEFAKPVVVAGFEPTDLLVAITALVEQVNQGRHTVENRYPRVVGRDGNRLAKDLVSEVFELRKEFEWRGLGIIPYSALRIKSSFRAQDAEVRFGLAARSIPDAPACQCHAVLRGALSPPGCKVFGTACTPETPLGACMVSSEGACAAWHRFRPGPVAPRP